jgi:hypothetical protein
MGDTAMLVRYVGIVAIVAVFSLSLFSWDESTPTVAGWTVLQTTLNTQNPESGFPQFQTVDPFYLDYCGPFDLPCHTGNIAKPFTYIGNLIWQALSWFFLSIAWLFGLIFAFFGALLGGATLTFDGMPIEVQSILWIVILPFFTLIIFAILRLVRGSEG